MPGIVQHLEARIVLRQIERLDIATEFGAAKRVVGSKKRLQAIRHPDIRAQPFLDDVLGVRRLAFET